MFVFVCGSVYLILRYFNNKITYSEEIYDNDQYDFEYECYVSSIYLMSFQDIDIDDVNNMLNDYAKSCSDEEDVEK